MQKFRALTRSTPLLAATVLSACLTALNTPPDSGVCRGASEACQASTQCCSGFECLGGSCFFVGGGNPSSSSTGGSGAAGTTGGSSSGGASTGGSFGSSSGAATTGSSSAGSIAPHGSSGSSANASGTGGGSSVHPSGSSSGGSTHGGSSTGGTPACAAQSFAIEPSLGVQSGPSAVAFGDVNGDGKPDLVVANLTENDVGVSLGDGNGDFAAQAVYAVGASPWAIGIGDFNGDGLPDLAVVNGSGASVSILLGVGGGAFGAQTTFAVGSWPVSVAVADFNRDGFLDLAVPNANDDTVSILLGVGNGSFAAQTTFAAGSKPVSVVAADFTGDGLLDLAIADSNGNSVSLLLGDGTGTFGAPTTFAAGPGANWIATADFNGDGHPDLAVANLGNYAGNTVSVLLGTGLGGFAAQETFAVGTGPFSLVAADFNADGHADLAVANWGPQTGPGPGGNTVSVLLGTGSGTFGPQVTYAAGANPWTVAAGDFSGDGRPDLAVANYGGTTISLLIDDCATACGLGQTSCGGACTDLQTDPDNCGVCGLSCGAADCLSGSCTVGCTIGGVVYGSGEANPADPCETCQPGPSTSGWTELADGAPCGGGGVCDNGNCESGCVIGGTFYSTGAVEPGGSCQACQPSLSTSGWTALPDGTACGSAYCQGGACSAACNIAGALYASGDTNPQDACQSCQPATSTYDWTSAANGAVCGSDMVCEGGQCNTCPYENPQGTIPVPDMCLPCTSDANCASGNFCVYEGLTGNAFCAPNCYSGLGTCPLNTACVTNFRDTDGIDYRDVCYPSGGTCSGMGMFCSACTSDAQCAGGLCIQVANGSFCSSSCADTAACPADWTCYASLSDADGCGVPACMPLGATCT